MQILSRHLAIELQVLMFGRVFLLTFDFAAGLRPKIFGPDYNRSQLGLPSFSNNYVS